MLRICLCILILILMTGCCCLFKDVTKSFHVGNFSDSTFYMYCACENTLPSDTANLQIDVFNSYGVKTNKIDKNLSGLFYVTRGGTPHRLISPCDNDTVRLFIIPEQIMENYVWEDIRKYQLFGLHKLNNKILKECFSVRRFAYGIMEIRLVGEPPSSP